MYLQSLAIQIASWVPCYSICTGKLQWSAQVLALQSLCSRSFKRLWLSCAPTWYNLLSHTEFTNDNDLALPLVLANVLLITMTQTLSATPQCLEHSGV